MRAVRIIVWAAVVALCALAFACTGAVALIGIAIALLVVPLLGWAALIPAAQSIKANLSSATSASKGAPVNIALVLENGSRVPVAHVQTVVHARNMLTSETCAVEVAGALSPRSVAEVPVELSSERCGRVECTVETVRLFEPFRMFSRTVACPAERRLTIVPTLHDVILRDIYAASPLSDTTIFSPYVRGTDLSEVFGLREYEPGDELKRIHWKLSEKLDQTVVRDASLPLDNSLLLFWDKHVSTGSLDSTNAKSPTGASSAGDVARRADAMAEVMLALMEQLSRAGVSFEVASNDIPASRCIRSFVTDENDIYETIGHLLSSPVMPASEAGLSEYVRFFGDLSCSRLVYVCCERPHNLEALLGNREALLLICDGGTDTRAWTTVTEIHFPADGARFALEMVGVM